MQSWGWVQDVGEERLQGGSQVPSGPGGVCSTHTTRLTPGAEKMSVQRLIPEHGVGCEELWEGKQEEIQGPKGWRLKLG